MEAQRYSTLNAAFDFHLGHLLWVPTEMLLPNKISYLTASLTWDRVPFQSPVTPTWLILSSCPSTQCWTWNEPIRIVESKGFSLLIWTWQPTYNREFNSTLFVGDEITDRTAAPTFTSPLASSLSHSVSPLFPPASLIFSLPLPPPLPKHQHKYYY